MILAIDSTGMTAAAAIVDDGIVVAEFSVCFKRTHSQTLMPIIDRLFLTTGIKPGEMEFIACSTGPGSYTGIRIGLATAKGLALGLGKKIIPVPTLDAMAYNVFESSRRIVPIMDARKSQVYTAFYERQGCELTRVSDYMALSVSELSELLNGVPSLFLGDGVQAYRSDLTREEFSFAKEGQNLQRASSVGALAIDILKKNADAAVDASEAVPFYLRRTYC